MDIDLTTQDSLKTSWSIDDLSGFLTITFKDSSDVVLGTVMIESDRFRSLSDLLDEIGRAKFPDLEPSVDHRTIFKKLENESDTNFG